MSKGLKLSPTHGVNPSLECCFWCGKSMGVVLCGHVHRKKGDHSDIEAPREMVTSLEPCPSCREQFAKGVQIIEVSDDGSRFHENKSFAIKDTEGTLHWPTGRFVVMRTEAVRGGKAGGHMLCDKQTMDAILNSSAQTEEKKEKTK